jgi:hypothetical protein
MIRKGCKVLCFLEEGRSGRDSSRRGLSGGAVALRWPLRARQPPTTALHPSSLL